jgi:amino acid efflux transporter
VAVAHVLAGSVGASARWIAGCGAVVIALGTANAFVAATSRLGYALARDQALPAPMARLTRRDVPATAVVVVGGIAAGSLLVALVAGWGADAFLVVSNSLVIVVYIAAMAAGVRLLSGRSRAIAIVATGLMAVILPFVQTSLVIPAAVAAGALGYRVLRPPRLQLCDR